MSVIERAALGRVAKIGELYDVKTESFTGDTLFGARLEDKFIETTDLGNTSIEFVISDNLQEKFKKLEVEKDLQISIVTGLVKLGGSGAYLTEEKKSARDQSMSLVYKVRTVNEKVMINNHMDKVDINNLSPSNNQTVDATHVVYAIDWGAACTVTCKYENTEDEKAVEVKGALSAELDKLLEKLTEFIDENVSIGGGFEGRRERVHRNCQKKITFSCNADVSTPATNLPVIFDKAVELAINLPNLVKNTNKGKGVPLTFMLKPLEDIVKMCNIQTNMHIQYRAIDDKIITKCGQIVENITKTKQTLYDIRTDLHASEDYVPDEALLRVDDRFEKFAVKESSFKGELRGFVKRARSGNKNDSSLASYIEEMSSTFSLSRCNEQKQDFQKDLEKLKTIKSMRNNGVIYIGRNDEFIVDDKRYVYVLYKTSTDDNTGNLEKNQEFFLRQKKTHDHDIENYKFVVVDQDIRKDLWPAGTKAATVHEFVNGRLISEDLYAENISQQIQNFIPEPLLRRLIHVKAGVEDKVQGIAKFFKDF